MAVRFPDKPQPVDIFSIGFENSPDCMINGISISHFTQIGKQGTNPGELTRPRGVAIDDYSNNIYVAEEYPARVSIFTDSGEFFISFTHEHMKQPHGIALHRNKVYVSDIGAHGVLHFKIELGIRINAVLVGKGSDDGKFNCPIQLYVSNNGEVFVADSNNHRIQILDEFLHFKRSIKHDSLKYPIDVKPTNNEVFVLTTSSPCVIVFSHAGEKLRSLITRGEEMQVINPWFFCMDAQQNLIFSDDGANCMKVFSPEAKLIYSIKVGTQSYSGLSGVATTKQLKIAILDNFKLNIYSC